jgi:predicted extracellular nuclease
MSTLYQIAFWNLENLFDIENSPRRGDKVARAIGKDIKGWTQELLDRKISQLASIIKQMNVEQGPDILGVCEVENEFVMDLLVQALEPLGRNYAVIHHDTEDRRGIDVAFIYDKDLFDVDAVFDHFVMRRTATRNLLQVNFKTKQGRMLVIVGNHWPSRSGGQFESEAYREIAGETLAYFHERILEVLGKDTPVLALGDFNDEPFNRSLTDYALAVRDATVVTRGRNPYLLNLMWPLMGNDVGSLYFNGPNLLDQILVNKSMIRSDSEITAIPDSVNVLRFPEMVTGGAYPEPRRFGGMGKLVDKDGYSDHYPVEVTVEEK